RIELDWIESGDDLFLVFGQRDFLTSHHVFRITAKGFAIPLAAEYGVRPPMNKASETCFAPPGDTLLVCFHRSRPPALQRFFNSLFIPALLLLSDDRKGKQQDKGHGPHRQL